MSTDLSIDACGDSLGDDIFEIASSEVILWNGREMRIVREKRHWAEQVFKAQDIHHKLSQRSIQQLMLYDHDLEELLEEFGYAYDTLPMEAEECKSFFGRLKRWGKDCVNGLKKTGKGIETAAKKTYYVVERAIKDTAHFVKDHPAECAIAVAAVTVGTVGAIAALSSKEKKREDELDEPESSAPSSAADLTSTSQDIFTASSGEESSTDTPQAASPTPFIPSKGLPTTPPIIFLPPPEPMTPISASVSPQDLPTTPPIEALSAKSSMQDPIQPPILEKKSLMHIPAPLTSAVKGFFGLLGGSLISPLISSEKSQQYVIPGNREKTTCVTFINGMDNQFEDAINSARYIQSLSANHQIDGIYNHTNGPHFDGVEIFTCNYLGLSPVTRNLLVEKWVEFHEANRDNPEAKILHFCHSQGALHTLNALLSLPKEIRSRVIVIAIAPAGVVINDLCFKSHNYASDKDIVHLGEDLMKYLAEAFIETDRATILQALYDSKKQLHILEAHAGATGIDHELQSPTYEAVIELHFREYINHNGVYK